jgi:hypothetical protein
MLVGPVFDKKRGEIRNEWPTGGYKRHLPISEIRRSMVDPSLKEFLSGVTHSSTAKVVVSCVDE